MLRQNQNTEIKEIRNTAKKYNKLGLEAMQKGDLEKAVNFFDQAIVTLEEIPENFRDENYYFNLAFYHGNQGVNNS